MYGEAIETAIKYLVAWFGIYLIYFIAFTIIKVLTKGNNTAKGLSFLFCIIYSLGIGIFFNIRSSGIKWDSALTVFIISIFSSLLARYNVHKATPKIRNDETIKRIFTEDYAEEEE
jgi:hypothetical protein